MSYPKIGKTQHNALYESRWKAQHNALYESRWKAQHNALYESRWKAQHNALYESRWKAQHNALYESRCGVEIQFYRGFVVIPTDLILRSKYLWDWLWENSSLRIGIQEAMHCVQEAR